MKLDVVGVIPMYSGYAMVLFDSGASHSFVSASYVKAHDMKVDIGNHEWHVRIPIRETHVSKAICMRCPLTIGYLKIPADLVVMEMNDFDIILGIDWLSEYYAFIDCRKKKVYLKSQIGEPTTSKE